MSKIMKMMGNLARVGGVIGGWVVKGAKASASPLRFIGKTAIGIGFAGVGVGLGITNTTANVDVMAAAILVGAGTILWILANLIDGGNGQKAE